jgi:6-phospho-3-hexuloisomerase
MNPNLEAAAALVLAENARTLAGIDPAAAEGLMRQIREAPRIFTLGEGRSGLVLRMFAMRLMHLGLQVYVVGETTTPSIRTGDLLVAISGSGETSVVVGMASKAREMGVQVAAVTTAAGSALAKTAHVVVMVPAAAKLDRSGALSQQFAGSLFEQASLLFFDAVFYVLAHAAQESAETLWAQHTNLE